jgi:hypothetical protein
MGLDLGQAAPLAPGNEAEELIDVPEQLRAQTALTHPRSPTIVTS